MPVRARVLAAFHLFGSRPDRRPKTAQRAASRNTSVSSRVGTESWAPSLVTDKGTCGTGKHNCLIEWLGA